MVLEPESPVHKKIFTCWRQGQGIPGPKKEMWEVHLGTETETQGLAYRGQVEASAWMFHRVGITGVEALQPAQLSKSHCIRNARDGASLGTQAPVWLSCCLGGGGGERQESKGMGS